MKALVVSDIHLKFGAAFTKIGADGVDSRLKELINSMLWAADEGVKAGCDMFIVPGDMFDVAQRLPTAEGIQIRDTLRTIRSKYKSVIALQGNHDMISENESILHLVDDIITVINKPTSITVQGAKLSFLPYQREKELLIAEMTALGKAPTVDPHYLFAHFWLKSEVGNDPDAPELDELPYKSFTKIITGHLHTPTKQSMVSKCPVLYVGTLANKNFAEAGPKGAWVVDFSAQSYTFVKNPHSPDFFKTSDTQIIELHNEGMLNKKAYYQVACDSVNILEITSLLNKEVLGFEIVNKEEQAKAQTHVDVDASVLVAEKKNSATLKDYILDKASNYKPDSATLEQFLDIGKDLLKGL